MNCIPSPNPRIGAMSRHQDRHTEAQEVSATVLASARDRERLSLCAG
jgi:hypothetical protein